MKTNHTLSLITFLLITSPLLASNYYWVGGTGTWSDYATHWATTSGGTVFHVTIPSPNDDVFFDANSFATTGDTIYLDTTITNCRTLDWSAATNAPVFKGGNTTLDIYGSFILNPSMTWSLYGSLHFKATSTGNVINSGGIPMGNISVNFDSAGQWDLQNSWSAGNLALINGTLKTNGYPLTCGNFNIANAASIALLLDTSLVICSEWMADVILPIIDADSATIQSQMEFWGGIHRTYYNVSCYNMDMTDTCIFHDVTCSRIWSNANTFHNVTMSASYDEINGTGNTFNKLIVPASSSSLNTLSCDTLVFNNPGQSVLLSGTITINSLLQADGNCSGLTSFTGGTMYKAGGTVTLNYVLLQNISASGGAAFTANNSVDGGNVTGFTINAPAPQNLYWVGGTGNWNDVNHWATSSGGAGGSCVPNQYDDVFFDINSFPSAGDTVYANVPFGYCHTLDWSAATNAPVFKGGNTTLDIYGSFILNPSMTWSLYGSLHFKATSTGNVINSGGIPMGNISVNFDSAGQWDLQNSWSAGNLALINGTLKTNGYPLTCGNFNIANAASIALLLDTSLVICSEWMADVILPIIDADSATIQSQMEFWGGIHRTYYNVSCYNMDMTDTCIFHDVTCSRIWSNANTFHNVTMSASYDEINGTGNTFNKLIVPASSSSLNTLSCDTLVFNNPGQSVLLSGTITINSLLQADGNCSGLTSFTGGTMYKAGGTVTLNYVLLQNISASGGAAFTANNSVDGGNVTGFTINAPAPQNLYWVGGTGNWNDVNHWATSSGGAGGSCVPNQYDDVFFDINSFPSAGDTVYANVPFGYCHTLDWSAATNAPVFKGGNTTLDIYGSFILNPSMTWSLYGSLHFKATSTGNVINSGGIPMGNISVNFDSAGQWDLQNSWSAGNLALINGTLKTNGYPLTCGNFNIANAASIALLLDTSLVICSEWMADVILPIIDADSATIQSQMEFWGGIHRTYYNVSCYNMDMTDTCIFHDVTCSRIWSNANTFHNVTMSASYDEINGTGNTFNKLIVPASSSSLNTLSCDTLVFNNPGQSVLLSGTTTINNYLLIQSDPGFPSSIECNGGNATISKPTDTVCTDFIYLKNITATGGAVYFAGDHSVDLGGNTGWNWVRCAPLISNVWPGDCNYDLVTDNFDLLNIGISFGDTGYVRPAASLSYTAQPCQDWYYQFINAANVKHADCDGNGIVDANDSTAISLNYGLTHPARLVHQDENNSTGTELDFILPPVIVPGSAVSVPVTLGTSVDPANAVYGIAFTVNYDPAFIQPGTMSVDYTSSWVENAGSHLHLEKDFPVAGKTDVAFTRIDHSDASGFGIIATLNFIASSTASGPFNLSFSHVKVISHNEIEIPIQTGTSTTWVNIDENGNEISSTVFPNPMTDEAQVIFSNPNHETWYFSMKDVTGRIIQDQQTTSGNSFSIARKNLNSGVYFYVIENENGKTGYGKLIVK